MSEWTEPETPASEQISTLGVRLVKAMMASATTDKIRPLDWWPRAKAALVTACQVADTFDHLVSRMADKLQIQALRGVSANSISSIAEALRDAARLETFTFEGARAQWARDALYIVAIAQVEREAERKAGKSNETSDTVDPTSDTEEPTE